MFNIKQISFIIGTLLLAFAGNSQEYNYIHYTNKEGLAGNTVYGVAQDKEGYLFFATENGLSRYDGKEWVTFTVKDGLPDNEILVIFGDSKGRIWMSCFSKAICYYYKGKVYNAENDSLVKGIKVNQLIVQILEKEDEGVFMQSNSSIYVIKNDNSLLPIVDRTAKEFNSRIHMAIWIDLLTKNLQVKINDSIFSRKNASLKYEKMSYDKPNNMIINLSLDPLKPKIILLKDELNTVESHDHRYTTFINTNNGTFRVDTARQELAEHFLSGIKIGHTYQDKEDNIWFTTLGQGLYKLPSIAIKTYIAPNTNNTSNREVFSISQSNQNILAGASFGKIITKNKISETVLDFQNYLEYAVNTININRSTSSTQINKNTTIIGFNSYLLKLQNSQPSFNYAIQPIKSIEKIDGNNIIVATGSSCIKVRISSLVPTDTLFTERTTYANYLNHQYYIGTINGLYLINENKKQTYLGNIHPSLTRRITCIKNTQDGKTFVATADAGIVILKNNQVIGIVNEYNGLSSNIIKTLHINNQFLWVGSIKGINKIDLGTNKIITKYSTSDGLPSDIINAIYIDNIDSTVWIGSPEGLTSFKENQINSRSICNLVMQNIIVSNKKASLDTNDYSFKYKDNNIQFQFVGISFRSGDDITYSYKLIGLDDGFKTTKERILSYPTLLPGSYTLQLFATNKFGIKSNTIAVNFFIATPFWKTYWFVVILMSMAITIVYIFLKRRFDNAKKIQAEKSLVKQQLADMEQLALQAQMNPHFIFNCLNSIQQFIMVDDKLKANQYLTEFATLIRSTLNNSSKKYISIAEEALYLKRYLDLEQLRFGDSFSYEINTDISVDKNFTQMPAMLLQPFVENSLRHGVRLKKTGKGIIKISFVESEKYLICSVIDNGVGREVSAKSKSHQHIEYQSKGMELTSKRINLLNTEASQNATVEIIDLKDENGVGIGTEVVVKIPVS